MLVPIVVNKEGKRKEILSAALEVFSQKGFYTTPISEVAQKAGIAKGTIYEYFKSKDELFISLLDYALTDLLEEFITPSRFEDPVKQLEDIFLKGLKIYQKHENLVNFFIFYWGESLCSGKSHIISSKLQQIYQQSRSLIENIYQQGVEEKRFKKMNPSHVSAALVALIEFIPMQWIIDKKAFSLREAGKTAFNIFLKGIIKDSKEKESKNG